MDKKIKILIADDEANVLSLSETFLKQEGYEVITASNGKQALEKVIFEKPDLIILDRNMPVMSGDEVCQKIRNNNDIKHIPIIFLTAQDSKNQIMEGYSQGANEYITKPFNMNELLEVIKNTLNKTSS